MGSSVERVAPVEVATVWANFGSTRVSWKIVLTPSRLSLGEGDFSADELRDRFGSIADSVLRDWTICIAEYIPAGVTLTDVKVEGGEVVADFDVDGRIVSDPQLLENGTCPA